MPSSSWTEPTPSPSSSATSSFSGGPHPSPHPLGHSRHHHHHLLQLHLDWYVSGEDLQASRHHTFNHPEPDEEASLFFYV